MRPSYNPIETLELKQSLKQQRDGRLSVNFLLAVIAIIITNISTEKFEMLRV